MSVQEYDLSLDCQNKTCDNGGQMSFVPSTRRWYPIGKCPDCKGTGKLPALELAEAKGEG